MRLFYDVTALYGNSVTIHGKYAEVVGHNKLDHLQFVRSVTVVQEHRFAYAEFGVPFVAIIKIPLASRSDPLDV